MLSDGKTALDFFWDFIVAVGLVLGTFFLLLWMFISSKAKEAKDEDDTDTTNG